MSKRQVEAIKETATRIVSEIGVKIESDEVFSAVSDTHGSATDSASHVVKFSPKLVTDSLDQTPKRYSV